VRGSEIEHAHEHEDADEHEHATAHAHAQAHEEAHERRRPDVVERMSAVVLVSRSQLRARAPHLDHPLARKPSFAGEF
jgi:hypothetical protein